MLGRALLFVGVFAVGLVAATAAMAERRVALVVGNSKYQHASTLRNPLNDANDVAKLLERLGFEVLLALDLDQQNFGMAIARFGGMLERADVGLFFYAGHGLQMNEKNYLVSTNAKLENEFLLSSETIELEMIVRLMESKAAVNLVFLDACRNNPLAENLKRSLAAMKRSGALGRGLAKIEPSGQDTLIAFAAAPGQEAADGNGRNSPFTTALLKHAPKPGLEVSVMLKEVAGDVRRDTQNAQRPQQLSDMTRTFFFAKAAEPPPVVAAAPAAPPAIAPPPSSADDRAVEVALWNAVSTANDCGSTRVYMQRFPNGIFIDLARLAEGRLCGADKPVAAPRPGQPQAPIVTSRPPPAAIVAARPAPPPLAPPSLPPPPTIVASRPEPPPIAPPARKGEPFRDCPECPEMIALAGGPAEIGSRDEASERPTRHIAVPAFALARYPVKVGEWKLCVAAKACQYEPKGEDDEPVRNVSWNDARQFLAWLSQTAGKPYRLPTEAEWEYAARGGTTTKYWWGRQPRAGMANCKGCGEPHADDRPLKAGSFPANPFGLFDMGGGVAQWVADCWHRTYAGAPKDASAWEAPACRERVLRGASWRNDQSYLRPSSRLHYDAGVRYPTNGFRVARGL